MAPVCPIKNFRWHLPGLLATGETPSRPGQLDWLLEQEFQAMVSLEQVPEEILAEIQQSKLNYFFLGASEEDGLLSPLVLQEFYWFTSHNLERGKPTFVHGGSKDSWSLIRKYLEFSLRANGWLLPQATVYQSHPPEIIVSSAGQSYQFDSQTGNFLPATNNLTGLKTVFTLTVPCRLICRPNNDFLLVVNFERWLPKYHLGQLAVLDLDPDWNQEAQIRLILDLAIALRSEDEAKWLWAHRHLGNDGCPVAVRILFKALDSGRIEIRRLTLMALMDLFVHTGCGCYGKECLLVLKKADRNLFKGFKKESDLNLRALFIRARRIFQEYLGHLGLVP